MLYNVVALLLVSQIETHVPGWELGTKGFTPIGQNETGFTVGVDPYERYGDAPSLTVASLPGATSGFRAAAQTIRADHYRGQRVRFRARVKASSVKGQSGIWLRVDNPGGDLLSLGSERDVSGTVDWSPKQAVFDVPKDAVDISFGPLLIGTGQVWVSDMKLEVVGKEVPLTNPPDPLLANPNPVVENLSLRSSTTRAGTTFKGWKTGAGAGVRSSMHGFQGHPAVVIGATHSAPGLYQAVSAAPYRGRRIRFRSQVRTQGVKDSADLFMGIFGLQDAQLTSGEGSPEPGLKGDHPWKELDVVLDVAPNAKAILFGYGVAGGGHMWISDASFEPVPRSVATTDRRPAGRNWAKEKIAALPLEPSNLQLNGS